MPIEQRDFVFEAPGPAIEDGKTPRQWSSISIVTALIATHPELTMEPTPVTQCKATRYNEAMDCLLDDYVNADTW